MDLFTLGQTFRDGKSPWDEVGAPFRDGRTFNVSMM